MLDKADQKELRSGCRKYDEDYLFGPKMSVLVISYFFLVGSTMNDMNCFFAAALFPEASLILFLSESENIENQSTEFFLPCLLTYPTQGQ